MTRFDPFGLAARLLPEKTLHTLIRTFGVLVCGAFLYRRILEYPDYYLKPLWAVETLIYIVLIAAFAVRLNPIDRARGVKEVVLPAIGAFFPFLLLLTPPNPEVYSVEARLNAVFWTMTAGTALTVWGMWTLRYAFSICAEARTLVTGGPYRLVRHPVYLGELIASAAVTAWRYSPQNLALYLTLLAIQLTRSRIEEQKLTRNFPDYSTTVGRKLWFWRAG